MEKRKIELIRSMQCLLTDFTVSDNGIMHGNKTNNTELSKLQQVFKMKTSKDTMLAKELARMEIISKTKNDKQQSNGEPHNHLSTREGDDPNSTAESLMEDYQWRFVETCMNSLLLLDQYMKSREDSSSDCLGVVANENAIDPTVVIPDAATQLDIPNIERNLENGESSFQNVDTNQNANTLSPVGAEIFNRNTTHQNCETTHNQLSTSDIESPKDHYTNNIMATDILSEPSSSRVTTTSGKTIARGKKLLLQHQPNYLGAKDLKIVSGVVQLILTYGVWPRLLQGLGKPLPATLPQDLKPSKQPNHCQLFTLTKSLLQIIKNKELCIQVLPLCCGDVIVSLIQLAHQPLKMVASVNCFPISKQQRHS